MIYMMNMILLPRPLLWLEPQVIPQLPPMLMDKPLKAKEREVYFLILLGCYQLLYMKIPPHAAVNETVESGKADFVAGPLWAPTSPRRIPAVGSDIAPGVRSRS